MDVLSAALALSLWVAFGSFVLAVVDGLDVHPARRLGIGLLLVVIFGAALAARSSVCGSLQKRPWLVSPFAAALLAVIAADGLVGGPYVAVSMTAIGIAVVVGRARTVWLCVAVLVSGYALGVFLEHAPADLADDGRLGGVIGFLVCYPGAALLLLGLRRRFTRFLEDLEPILSAIRNRPSATTPALGRALRAEPIALPSGPPPPALTPAERRVVEALAGGLAPKEVAFEWAVSIHTVRSHISSAKRKTGAKTLRELAALHVHSDRGADAELV